MGIVLTFNISIHIALKMRTHESKCASYFTEVSVCYSKIECDDSSSNTLALFTIYKHEILITLYDLNIGHLYYV